MSELANTQEGWEIGWMKGRAQKQWNLQACHIGTLKKSV